jgi:hypothetical protein
LGCQEASLWQVHREAELAAKLGLKTTAARRHYDLIIVGGGPAGMAAALYSAREGIDTLVVERAALGGQAATTERLDNVPGFAEGIEGGNQRSRDFCRGGCSGWQYQTSRLGFRRRGHSCPVGPGISKNDLTKFFFFQGYGVIEKFIDSWTDPISVPPARLTRLLLCDYIVIALKRKEFPHEDSFGPYW